MISCQHPIIIRHLGVATIVAKCLQRAPGQRYPDMGLLIRDLDHSEQVDTSHLQELCAAPRKPSFFENQFVRTVIASVVLMIAIVLLGLLIAAMKHGG